MELYLLSLLGRDSLYKCLHVQHQKAVFGYIIKKFLEKSKWWELKLLEFKMTVILILLFLENCKEIDLSWELQIPLLIRFLDELFIKT